MKDNINCEVIDHSTLLFAIKKGDLPKIKYICTNYSYLLNCKRSSDGYTALHYAVITNQVKVMELLINLKADPNIKAFNQKTAADLCMYIPRRKEELVNSLKLYTLENALFNSRIYKFKDNNILSSNELNKNEFNTHKEINEDQYPVQSNSTPNIDLINDATNENNVSDTQNLSYNVPTNPSDIILTDFPENNEYVKHVYYSDEEYI